jgi:hypothetical protein
MRSYEDFFQQATGFAPYPAKRTTPCADAPLLTSSRSAGRDAIV